MAFYFVALLTGFQHNPNDISDSCSVERPEFIPSQSLCHAYQLLYSTIEFKISMSKKLCIAASEIQIIYITSLICPQQIKTSISRPNIAMDKSIVSLYDSYAPNHIVLKLCSSETQYKVFLCYQPAIYYAICQCNYFLIFSVIFCTIYCGSIYKDTLPYCRQDLLQPQPLNNFPIQKRRHPALTTLGTTSSMAQILNLKFYAIHSTIRQHTEQIIIRMHNWPAPFL